MGSSSLFIPKIIDIFPLRLYNNFGKFVFSFAIYFPGKPSLEKKGKLP